MESLGINFTPFLLLGLFALGYIFDIDRLIPLVSMQKYRLFDRPFTNGILVLLVIYLLLENGASSVLIFIASLLLVLVVLYLTCLSRKVLFAFLFGFLVSLPILYMYSLTFAAVQLANLMFVIFLILVLKELTVEKNLS